jgi:hypothetical protein
MLSARPADDAQALLRPGARSNALASEPDSLLNTVATFVLILGEDLETACAGCTALIDLARPRGWLIALAHGSFLRATALVRAGRIREAEADARLSFEFKLPPQPACRAALGALPAHRRAHRARRAGRRRRGAHRRGYR